MRVMERPARPIYFQGFGDPGTPTYPHTLSLKEESILHSLVNLSTAALVIAYLMTTLPKDTRPIQSTIGWMGMGMAWWVGLEGLAGVIGHLSPKSSEASQVRPEPRPTP